MIRIRTKTEDYRALGKLVVKLHKKVADGKYTSPSKYENVKKRLKERFSDRIFPEDFYLFDNLEAAQNFLFRNFTCKMKPKVVEHELEHIKEAESLGYKPKVGIQLLLIKTEDGIYQDSYIPFIYLDSCKIADHKKITEAPKELSEGDKLILGIA